MRNLKRVLSLALASVMLLGMMVMGAGAADYTDVASISQKEAAEVLESIGVMQGNDKGEFLPTAELTREAAAKIITYMLLGKKEADDLKAYKDPFDDVKADRWSAGSIAYCANQGIISGDGKGNFFPEATVTGTQFAKMLLGALGYKAQYENFIGSGYELSIAKMVVSIKLNRGIDRNLSATLTRDDAARMALNTLTSFLVEYTGGVDVSNDGMSVNIGGTRRYVTNLDAAGNVVNCQFMEVYQTSLTKSTVNTGKYGRPSYKWMNGKDTIGTYFEEPEQVYTAGAKAADMREDLSGFNFETGNTVVYINGVASYNLGTNKTANNTILNDLVKNGRLVEFYTAKRTTNNNTNNGTNVTYYIDRIVVVDTVLAKIQSINTVTNEIMYQVESIVNGNENLPFGIQSITKANNKAQYEKLAEMKSGDRVLLTFNNNAVASVAVPETVTGTFTAITSNGKRTVAGNTYDTAYASITRLNGDAGNNVEATMEVGNDYLVYLDTYGNVVFAAVDSSISAKNAFIMDDEKTGNLSVEGRVYNVKLLFEDGTQSWVKVGSLNGISSKANNFETHYNSIIQNKNTFVKYTVRADGTYAMTTSTIVTAGDVSTIARDPNNDVIYSFNGMDINKNSVNFLRGTNGGAVNGTLMGSGKTVFLVSNNQDNTYKAYTGITSIPNWQNVSGQILVTKNTTSAAMVILGGGSVQSADDFFYLLSTNPDVSYNDGETIYTYKGIMNGVAGTVSSTTRITNGKGLYQVTAYSGEYVATSNKVVNNALRYGLSGTVASGTAAKGVLEYASGTVIVKASVGAGNYVASDNMAVFSVNSDGNAAQIAAGDMNFYKNITEYSLIKDDNGFVIAVIFVYGAQ